MTISSFNIPDAIAARYSNWQAIVSDKCPLTATSLHYAVANSIKINFVRGENLDEDIAGKTFIAQRRIELSYETNWPISKLLHYAGHEIKHVKQIDECSGLDQWTAFSEDIDESRSSNQYRMADSYTLISPTDYVFLGIANEMDAYPYGICVLSECIHAFSPIRNSFPTQTAVDSMYNIMFENPKIFEPLVAAEVEWMRKKMIQLSGITRTYDMRPFIKQISLPLESLRKISSGFWRENGLNSPFCGDKNEERLPALREKIAEDRRCVALEQEFQDALLPESIVKPFRNNRYNLWMLDF